MPEWGEYYTRNGFQLAMQNTQTLRRVWKIEQQSNEGGTPWYPDAEMMRYCFFKAQWSEALILLLRRPKRSRQELTAAVDSSRA